MDHMDLIKALIVFGADVEIHNDLGETPGLIAARTSKGKKERKRRRSGRQGCVQWRMDERKRERREVRNCEGLTELRLHDLTGPFECYNNILTRVSF